MDDMMDELQTTAERVERFRAIHEDAVRDLRDKIADARSAGYGHEQIDGRIRDARESVRRFQRMTRADDFLDAAVPNGNGDGAAAA
jgi:uncharacterized protein (UPF0335 family)